MTVQPPPVSPAGPIGCYSDFGYAAFDRWAQLPSNRTWIEVAAVATDSKNRVFVFNRGEHPVIIFERDGTYVDSWGEGLFGRPHGIFIGPDDAVYCIDDLDHTVRKFTYDGRLLLTLGSSGEPSNTGATSTDYRTIRRAGPPFHYPTNLALSPLGEMYVTDGYGNARVHKFAPDGRLLYSWGQPGSGPGHFQIPHGIAVDSEGLVYVADRENSRIQIFTSAGEFVTEWTDVVRPCQVFVDAVGDVYVAELGFHAGTPVKYASTPMLPGGRVSIFDRQGTLRARWGGGLDPCALGDFFAPHGICVDLQGDIYVAEVVMSAGANRGLVSPTCHSLQKFVRQNRNHDSGALALIHRL
jgi:DNA-binding beta-propeller fold protein YncE